MADDRSPLLLPRPWALALLAALAAGGTVWWSQAQPPDVQASVPTGAVVVGALSRTGSSPVFPAEAPERRDGCTHLIRFPAWSAVSDKGLADHAGLFNASPAMLLEDDQALTPHSRGGDCDGGFAHGPLGLFVRPASGDASQHRYTVRLTSDLDATPRRGPQGPQRIVYVHPGTTLTLELPQRWQDAWGTPQVQLAAVVSEAEAPAILSWENVSASIDGVNGPVRSALTVAPPTGASTLTLTVPEDGPVVVLHDLVLGSDEGLTAVLGSEAGLAPPEAAAAAEADTPPYTVSRVGPVPRMPLEALPPGDASCRHLIPRDDLEDLSDLRLFERYGFVSASPLRVEEDGILLAAHDRGEGCTGAVAHPPQGLVVRPSSPEGAGHRYAVTYAPEPQPQVEVRGGSAQHIAWAYPGTKLHLDIPEPLRAGPHDAVMELVAFGGTAPAALTHGGDRTPVPPNAGDARVAMRAPAEAPWRLTVDVPTDGPVVLVRGLEGRPILDAPAAPPNDAPVPTTWPLTVGGADGWRTFAKDPADAEIGEIAPGLKMRATTPGPGTRWCSAYAPADGDVTVTMNLAIDALEPGDKPWMTASVEDGWRDAEDAHVEVDGKLHFTRFPLLETGPAAPRTYTFPAPGGESVRVCVRFAQSTGTIRLLDLQRL